MIQAYGKYAIANQTLPKTRQIVLLYDGAVNFLMQAKDAIEADNIEERFTLLDKAGQIINGLQSSLDFENGGDVAKTLFDFYANLSATLRDVQRTGNVSGIDFIVRELKNMRASWEKIDQGDLPPAAPASPEASQDIILPREAAPMPANLSVAFSA